MAFPQVVWVATPDKTNHETKGYTSKVIFNFQAVSRIHVPAGDDVFEAIVTNGQSFKGSPSIPRGYFLDCDGRTFKITMYFYKLLDGVKMNLSQGIFDESNGILNTIATPVFATDTDNLEGNTLAKYECVISSFFDPSFIPSGQYLIQGIGNITYANSTNGTNVIMEPIAGGTPLSGGYTSDYRLVLLNACTGHDIEVVSLIVEEIS